MKNQRRQKLFSVYPALLGAALLAGCGGGGGGSAPTYTLGGSITGFTNGQLQLQNNGGDTLTVSAGNSFQFKTALGTGKSYAVTITSQPANHNCVVSSDTGTVAAVNVDTIVIECNVVPTGYYSGKATLMSTTGATDEAAAIEIGNVHGMISDNRMMLMSQLNDTDDLTYLVYDGEIIVDGDSYSGTLAVYKDGLRLKVDDGNGVLVPVAVPVSGTIVGGSSIEGALSGSGVGNGTFTLAYAESNSQQASYARIQTTYDPYTFEGTWWGTTMGNQNPGGFAITSNPDERVVSTDIIYYPGVFRYCEYISSPMSSVTPVSGTALFAAEIELSRCNLSSTSEVNGVYSGLATLLSVGVMDNTLLLVYTDGQFSHFAEYKLVSFF